jgi:hypothetical protein
MQRQAIRQGFCYEGSATGAYILLAKYSPPLPNLLPHSRRAALATPHLVPNLLWIPTSTQMFLCAWASRTRMRVRKG